MFSSSKNHQNQNKNVQFFLYDVSVVHNTKHQTVIECDQKKSMCIPLMQSYRAMVKQWANDVDT